MARPEIPSANPNLSLGEFLNDNPVKKQLDLCQIIGSKSIISETASFNCLSMFDRENELIVAFLKR
jgi:hypothetical protein